jgi:hypothetical protein
MPQLFDILVKSNSTHPELIDWVSRGGVLSTTFRNELNNLYYELESNNLRSKIGRLNLLVGNTFSEGVLVPQIRGFALASPIGNAVDTNQGSVAFTAADWSMANGLQGKNTASLDTSVTYVDLGMTVSNAHLSFTLGGTPNFTNRTVLSGVNTTNNGIFQIEISASFRGTTIIYLSSNFSGLTSDLVAPFRSISATATNRLVTFGNNSIADIITTTRSALNTSNLRTIYFTCANNSTASGSSHTLMQHGHYSLGLGMTDSEMLIYNGLISQFLRRIGRNYY